MCTQHDGDGNAWFMPTDFVKNADMMWRQSVWSSTIAAAIAAHHLKEGGLISLPGAKPAVRTYLTFRHLVFFPIENKLISTSNSWTRSARETRMAIRVIYVGSKKVF